MNLFLLKHQIKHFFKRKNEYSIHSPFMFEFYNKIIKSNRNKPERIIELIEKEYENHKLIIIPSSYHQYSNIYNKTEENTIIIIRTPYLNPNFQKEFKKIICSNQKDVVVDLFHLGLIFINPKLRPQLYKF